MGIQQPGKAKKVKIHIWVEMKRGDIENKRW